MVFVSCTLSFLGIMFAGPAFCAINPCHLAKIDNNNYRQCSDLHVAELIQVAKKVSIMGLIIGNI